MPLHIGPQIQAYRALLESKVGNKIKRLKITEGNFRGFLS